MAKITKKLNYRKASQVKNVSLYSAAGDVGSSYIALRVDAALAYAQTALPGAAANQTDLRVKKGSTVYAANAKVEDPTMISAGGSAARTGSSISPPAATAAYYYWSGYWRNNIAWNEPDASTIRPYYTVTISRHNSLSDVKHFRLKYGTDTGCTADGGTFTGTSISAYGVANAGHYFKVVAEDAANNALFESAVYGPVGAAMTKAGFVTGLNLVRYNSAGTAIDTVVSVATAGEGAVARGPSDYDNNSNTYRWFTTRSYFSGSDPAGLGYRESAVTCADTCSCNCNYCTCNCNYCTCNCNYCTCNCDYSPCGCSSGN
ncbi:MAG: hypothetical protein P4N41_16740 [Negativicutes bacterium]|nr:hypothetical protein [Negativicutes bacterium]MDR3591303.1 hypothetical protein [Negativicutes bacterium]